jgi:hypothetical protein
MNSKTMELILATTLTLTSQLAVAEDVHVKSNATPGTTAYDILVVRPVGLVATVAGSAVFILGLPFSLISDSTEESAQQLVVKPANYTFSRPLGQDMGGFGGAHKP